jgi:hypothetical protein
MTVAGLARDLGLALFFCLSGGAVGVLQGLLGSYAAIRGTSPRTPAMQGPNSPAPPKGMVGKGRWLGLSEILGSLRFFTLLSEGTC